MAWVVSDHLGFVAARGERVGEFEDQNQTGRGGLAVTMHVLSSNRDRLGIVISSKTSQDSS